MSRSRLDDADARAAATGYAGLSEADVRELRTEVNDATSLAAAPVVPLGETVHKERAAHRARQSRGGRRE
jgi:hypothetical protein